MGSVHVAFPHFSIITTFAGAMKSPSSLYCQPQSKPGRRPRRVKEGEELGRKPKKINSEARKQQNKIASRKYSMSYLNVVTDQRCITNT
jgi:hypothetical protein